MHRGAYNIYLCDLFYLLKDIKFASYVDDNRAYGNGNNIDEVIRSLEQASVSLFKWFFDNQMKVNPDKCHLILSTNSIKKIKIGETIKGNSSCEKLLR